MKRRDDATPPLLGMQRKSEARRRLHENWQVTARLEAETSALLDACEGLRADQRALKREQEALEQQCSELEARIEATEARHRAVEAESRSVRDEITAGELRASSARRQCDRLMPELLKLEKEVATRKKQMASAEATVDSVSGSMLRMDYKLRHGGPGMDD